MISFITLKLANFKPLFKKNRIPFYVLEVLMIVLAFVYILPGILILINSFKSDAQVSLSPIALPTTFYLDNYLDIWSRMEFAKLLLNTFLITAASTAGIVLISSMAAYAMVRTKLKISWLIFSFIAFSMVVPFQTIMVPLVKQAVDYNLASMWGIIPMYWGLGCPMAIFLYHGFIKGVPFEIEEAATIDGAGIFVTFFKIVFPLLTPITATVVILNVLWIWNDFLLPLLIIKKGTIQLMQFSLIGAFRQEWGRATASVILSALPVVIFYIILQKYIVKGITAGAVKG
jgi:raffinose/stachyose/melibiose transport system permease protein